VALPGGDFPVDGVEALIAQLGATYPFLSPRLARRLVRTYGTEAFRLLGDAKSLSDLGRDFGAGLTEAEVNWLVRNEYALSAQDILWRRTKLGLHMNDEQVRALDDFIAAMPAVTAAAE
jgi:glycerol-3-phosphate dehydrogenase